MTKNPLSIATARKFQGPVEALLERVEQEIKAAKGGLVSEKGRVEIRGAGLPLLREFCGEPHRIYQGFEMTTRDNDLDSLKTARGILRALKAKVQKQLET